MRFPLGGDSPLEVSALLSGIVPIPIRFARLPDLLLLTSLLLSLGLFRAMLP